MTRSQYSLCLAALVFALAACAPSPAARPSSAPAKDDLRMVRQYRSISLERVGQYGPFAITLPAYTAQEFVLTANPSRVARYVIQVRGTPDTVGVFVCAGRPCIGFASTADWKDLSANALKGPEIRVNGTKSDYLYVLNSSATAKRFSLVATAR